VPKREIQVEKRGDRWCVSRGETKRAIKSFALKAHANAFARVLAHSNGADLVIYDANGVGIRQARATLTYPKVLE
jgi:hypothetical protein